MTTWANESKNSASFANTSKNAASLTNESKTLSYSFLLMESGDALLMESGDNILLETAGASDNFVNQTKN